MIRIVKYHDIDFDKYSECVKNSEQYVYYSDADILNFLAKNWEILVFGDYSAVMPVPYAEKFGFKMVNMPLFCQQLGIFSRLDDIKVNSLFFTYFKKNYHVVYYAFNHHNRFNFQTEERKCYEIGQSQYPSIKKKYTKGRKSATKNTDLDFSKLIFNEKIKIFINNYQKGLKNKKDIALFFSYLSSLDTAGELRVFSAEKNGTIAALALIIEKSNKLYLLSLVSNPCFKKENPASFLIDKLLEKKIEVFSLNFMGGELQGSGFFFKSFGAENFPYPILRQKKWNFLIRIKNLIQKNKNIIFANSND